MSSIPPSTKALHIAYLKAKIIKHRDEQYTGEARSVVLATRILFSEARESLLKQWYGELVFQGLEHGKEALAITESIGVKEEYYEERIQELRETREV